MDPLIEISNAAYVRIQSFDTNLEYKAIQITLCSKTIIMKNKKIK